MKKVFLVGLFLILILFGISAQQNTGSINLSGVVPQVLNVTLPNDSTFNLNENGGTVNLGDIIFKSNLKHWVIKVYSTNGSILKNNDNDSEDNSIIYTFTLDSLFSNITLKSTEPVAGDGVNSGYIEMLGKTPKIGNRYNTLITYLSDGGTFWSYDKGSYTDTINVKVAAN